MTSILPVITVMISVAVLILVFLLIRRKPEDPSIAFQEQSAAMEKRQALVEQTVKDEIARNREETASGAKLAREELTRSMRDSSDALLRRMTENAGMQKDMLDSFSKQLGDMTPDGFTGAVKDLKDGLQEVIDADGTVIPVSTDDLLTSLSGSTDSSAETDGEAGSEPVADSPAAGGAANRKDRGEVSESEPADDSSPAPQPAAKPEPGNQPVDSHPKNSPDPQA